MVDTIAHALWSFIIFRTLLPANYIWLAIFFGTMPDLFSWTIYAIYKIFKDHKFGKPNLREIPKWAFTLYNVTHSVFVAAFLFSLIDLIFGYIPFYLWAWPLHILIDIPTHSRKFLPTPFLWPVSKWKFPGVSWAELWLFWLNWILIIVFLLLILLKII